MPSPNPKIYHITHIDNLAQMADSSLWSDAERLRRSLPCTTIGMGKIKRRRLEELEVHCHPGTKVGEYVPFYFCPRSIMLYLLDRGNHPDIAYRGGQTPIAHLEAGLTQVVDWASRLERRWAFTNGNAGAGHAQFFKNLADLDNLDWNAIESTDWRDAVVKHRKQAEFLLHRSLPWKLITKLGVINGMIAQQVATILRGANHQPQVAVERNWYY